MSVLRALLGILAATACLAAPVLAQRETRERHVVVGVTGANGAPVQGLTARDFVVREDDISREVIAVSAAPPPAHIAILVDDSQVEDVRVPDLRQGLVSFVRAMTSLPSAPAMSLTTFGDRPNTLVHFTTSEATLDRSIQNITPRTGAGAHFLDATIEACQALRSAGAESSAIVAFVVDGSPEFSAGLSTLVGDALRASGTSLWVIELQDGAALDSPEDRERATVIGDMTTTSGGMTIPILSDLGIDTAFRSVSTAFASGYDVTYARPDALIPPSRLTVETRNRALHVRATHWTGQ